VFTRSTPNYKARPFGQTDVYELDLATMALQKLIKGLRWLNAVQYAPNGKHLLLQGGPSLLGSLGRTKALGTKTTANDYEGELYLYNLHTRSYRTLTKSFAPHVVSAHWHPVDGKIYITALDRTRYQLFRCHPRTGTITPVDTGVDIVRSLQFASKNLQVVYSGQSLTHPARVYTLNLAKPTPRMLYAPNGKWFSRLRMSRVKSWNTVSKQGTKIEGRVYYPPDFDPRRKYPAIVYYYGGTFPTPRYFDGAYSGHLWAAHGYVVYILQPSGAIGYGQTFAARHVGEWGTIVPGEIISSTRAFLKAHPFVDPKRVGCTGASYGGFTTMSIVTKTSLFAAAISHAGISNVTSYWGAGYWGFLYSSIAAAHKYPWSHPNYFLKQSPLFSAHKVTTPLLLIHGTNDVNVPPAESYQMYTALRLLKKPVELVLFKGEGHGIFKKRHLWIQTIIAWFEKNLKKRPLWWNTMYGTQQR
jgi:dipeptidyl aminopeptidase/acylaminoacyl peptidase